MPARISVGPIGDSDVADELKPVILTFGGGINRRRRAFDIDPQECFDGQNFDLDHQFNALHRRNAIELRGVAPNAAEIRGYAQLQKRDGTITTLIQAGSNIYSWDGFTSFTLVGTCSAASKLRGARDQTFQLDDIVVITDLNKATIVQQWNGTALSNFSHNLSAPLYAKFLKVHGERGYFGNVQSGTDTPHVLLGSALSDIHTLTVTDRPSSAISAADPFFIPTPDLKPINGLEVGFSQFLISTQNGKLFSLSGNDAQDFVIDSFFDGSFVAGDEAMVNIGNDVLLGPKGRLDLLSGVVQFGDVETDDVSVPIKPFIEDVTGWRLAYDRSEQKAYCFGDAHDEIWVLHKSLLNAGKFSPWSRWVTTNDTTFQPSTVLSIVDPSSGLDAVFIGDDQGQIFKLEGNSGQDGGGSYIKDTSATSFPGTTGYIHRGGALTGAADSSIGILSFWLNPNTAAGAVHLIMSTFVSNVFQIVWNPVSQRLSFNLANGANNVTATTDNNSVPVGSWTHCLLTWDVNAAAGFRTLSCALNGSNVPLSISADTGVAFNIAYTGLTDLFIGVDSSVTPGFDYSGCLTEFYFAPGQYLDISNPLNIQKFISPSNQPVNIGPDGSLPTGTAPIIYLTGTASEISTNMGSGGNFTVVGTLTDCGSAPPFGATDIEINRRSIMFSIPDDRVMNVTGWITYLKTFAATVTLTFEYAGHTIFDKNVTIPLDSASTTGLAVYNGSGYFSGSTYYNSSFAARLTRKNFSVPGIDNYCQVKISVTGAADIEIHEIGLNFEGAGDK